MSSGKGGGMLKIAPSQVQLFQGGRVIAAAVVAETYDMPVPERNACTLSSVTMNLSVKSTYGCLSSGSMRCRSSVITVEMLIACV